ncbi:MAG TPA: proprotein convertase P-domain-containing protein, partial [Pyrinomonadaceae bacterium]|nr:proprotein convertase P-domain-containing protein [Pyrinomonadaceae bacterium]
LGTVAFTFPVGTVTAGQINTTTGTGNLAAAIPDAGFSEIPINVAARGLVSDVNVRVRLDHQNDGDVDLFLVAPDGTEVELSTDNGGTGANYGTGTNDCAGTFTVFDDSAANSITTAAAPFAGTFKPESALAAFNGRQSFGTWKLRVADDAVGDTGTLGCVQLELTRRPYACCGITGTPDVQAAGTPNITAESVSPANNAPDPEETVTVNLPLQNVGDGATTNLTATLLATGGVNNPTGPQSYGALTPGGAPVARPFTFTAGGACGTNITATLQLSDGTTPLGTVAFTLRLGASASGTQNFAAASTITIPSVGTATPYPATINVSGLNGTITKVTVALVNINHTFPADVDVLLAGPQGQNLIIMSDAGGNPDLVNVSLTFDDAAAQSLPNTTQIVSGTYKPTNYAPADTFAAPAPAATSATTLATFNGTNPNGAWRLYVVDDTGTDGGNIAGGWALSVTTAGSVCNTQACTLNVPANVVAANDANACGANVNYNAPTYAGSCGVVTSSPAAGSFFPVGTTVVNVDATPVGGGAQTTNSFTVKVNDAQPPAINCPANISTPATNASGALVNFNVTAADNCAGASVVSTPASGATFPMGTTTVNNTATDASGNTSVCSFNVTVTAPVIISEFRPRGVAGSEDEFVELYNSGTTPVTVTTTDGSNGWSVAALDAAGTSVVPLFRIPNGTTIPARGHFLGVNNVVAGYSLADYGGAGAAAGDAFFNSGANIPDAAGLALFQTNNAANYTLANRLDAVGFTGQTGALADLFREGAGLAPVGAVNGEYSFVRALLTGVPQDTGSNANDFLFVATDGGTYGGVQAQLGAPGPENLRSPVQRNAQIKTSLIEPQQLSTAAPNRVRDTTPVVNGAEGTLEIRRRFKNSTGRALSRLRFRVVDITSRGTPNPGGAQSDVRLLTSTDLDVTTSLGALTVMGTLVEQPPHQPAGGGLNTSAVLNLPGIIANGATVDVRFLLGVQTNGRFRFLVNIEALP